MDIQLVPATVDDIADIASCACRAFADDALEKAIFPKSEAPPGSNPNLAFRLERIRKAFQSPAWHYVVATVNPPDAPRRIVGYAAWKAPQTSTEQEQTQVDPDDGPLPRGVDAEAIRYATEAVEKAKKAWLGYHGYDEKDMWYLASLGVDPDFRRRRIGSKLTRWGLELADKEFQSAYVVASPAAVRVYYRLGFEELFEELEERVKVQTIKDQDEFAILMVREKIEP